MINAYYFILTCFILSHPVLKCCCTKNLLFCLLICCQIISVYTSPQLFITLLHLYKLLFCTLFDVVKNSGVDGKSWQCFFFVIWHCFECTETQCRTQSDGINMSLGLPDYGFYTSPGDQRAALSFADYGSMGPRATQMLRSDHAASASNSPLHHLPSPDQFKSPGLYSLSFIGVNGW